MTLDGRGDNPCRDTMKAVRALRPRRHAQRRRRRPELPAWCSSRTARRAGVGRGCEGGRVDRVSLSRLPGDRVRVADRAGERVLPTADLAAHVRQREAAGETRWVWDDTARWYPPLLAAGTRVERCH